MAKPPVRNIAPEYRDPPPYGPAYRLRVRWRMWRNSGPDLNRRVEVENELLRVASGKRGPLSKDECRALALKLGTQV